MDTSSSRQIVAKLLEQKLMERVQEERIAEACKNLQMEYDDVAGKKIGTFEGLMKILVEYPTGKIAIEHIINETVFRCDALLKFVDDKSKAPEPQELTFSTSKNEFTMMPHRELECEFEKLKEENEQSKSNLAASMLEAKKTNHIIDLTSKEVVQFIKHLVYYLDEMREGLNKAILEPDLQNETAFAIRAEVHSNHSTEGLTMSGLEEQINDI